MGLSFFSFIFTDMIGHVFFEEVNEVLNFSGIELGYELALNCCGFDERHEFSQIRSFFHCPL